MTKKKDVFFALQKNDYFEVDKNSGKVILAHPIDREIVENGELRIKVYARDQNGLDIEEPSEIVIKVNDINDNSPIFDKNSYQGSVPENSPIGKTCKYLLPFRYNLIWSI